MLMRNIMIITMMLFALNVSAQKKYDALACTGNNVNVRTGPGLNYQVQTQYCNEKVQLMKGTGIGVGYENCEHETGNYVLIYLGVKKNGFMKIGYYGEGIIVEGWVSSKYLKKVCPWCEGYPKTYDDCDEDYPRLLRVCKKCNGRGY